MYIGTSAALPGTSAEAMEATMLQLACQLHRLSRRTDSFSRMGVCDFAALLPGNPSVAGLMAMGQKIAAEFADRIHVHIGVALCPRHASDADTLLQQARTALDQARHAQVVTALFEPRSVPVHSGFSTATDGSVRAAFQPVLDLKTGGLSRLQISTRGLSPAQEDFSPTELGSAGHNTRQELYTRLIATTDTALRSALALRQDGLVKHLSLPLPGRLLDHPSLAQALLDLLDRHRWPAQHFLVEAQAAAIAQRGGDVLEALSQAGVGLSIQDGGSGLSLHVALAGLDPVGEFKLDVRALSLLPRMEQRTAVVRALMALARGWGARVVADGGWTTWARSPGWASWVVTARRAMPAASPCQPSRCGPGAPGTRTAPAPIPRWPADAQDVAGSRLARGQSGGGGKRAAVPRCQAAAAAASRRATGSRSPACVVTARTRQAHAAPLPATASTCAISSSPPIPTTGTGDTAAHQRRLCSPCGCHGMSLVVVAQTGPQAMYDGDSAAARQSSHRLCELTPSRSPARLRRRQLRPPVLAECEHVFLPEMQRDLGRVDGAGRDRVEHQRVVVVDDDHRTRRGGHGRGLRQRAADLGTDFGSKRPVVQRRVRRPLDTQLQRAQRRFGRRQQRCGLVRGVHDRVQAGGPRRRPPAAPGHRRRVAAQARQPARIRCKTRVEPDRPDPLPRRVADRQPRRRRHLRQHQRVGCDKTARHRRRGRGGEGAARAMRVPHVEPRQRQPAAGVRRVEPVERVGAVRAVTAGDADGRCAECAQCGGLCGHVGERRGVRLAEQPRRLAPVRRDEVGARQQVRAVGVDQRGVREGCAARARAEHRVDHQPHARSAVRVEPVQPARQHGHAVHAADQTGLDDGRPQVGGQRRELRIEHLGRDRHDPLHAERVLRRDGRDHRAEVDRAALSGPRIGAQAGAAAAVVAGDAPDDRTVHGAAHSRNGRPPTGVVATAIDCGAITPASKPSRPACTACPKAAAIRTGSRACDTAEFSSTAS